MRISVKRIIFIWFLLAISNFGYHHFTDLQYLTALRDSYYQGSAYFVLYLVNKLL